jgi:3-oxoacyl-[acyl-carrier protein] reductase
MAEPRRVPVAPFPAAVTLPGVNRYNLSGRFALVTGASSGIGAATAIELAGLGARVAVGYHSNLAGATATVEQIVAAGGDAVAFAADMRNAGEVRELVEEAVGWAKAPVDILVNNAGSLVARLGIRELTEARLDEILALNLKSAVLASQAVADAMIARRSGSIINVVSIAGHNGGGPGAGAYAAAKAALTAYTKSLAKELAPHGVRVNAIAPGVIGTPFHDVFSTPEMIANFVKAIPMGRVGTSEECASVIAFLASDAASYITGETIDVNGGQLMR